MIPILVTTCIRLVCGHCRQDIEKGTNYVLFDRRGETCRWHPHCFNTLKEGTQP